MAEIKQLVKRRKSAKGIKKITKTMALIAAAKFKQTMNKMSAAKPYAEKLNALVADLMSGGSGLQHPLFEGRKEREKIAVLAITSSRGFCGSYNAKIIELAKATVNELTTAGKKVSLHMVGKKGVTLLSRKKMEMIPYLNFGDTPKYADVHELAQQLVRQYTNGEIDEVKVVYTSFVSASKQIPVVTTFLPFPADEYRTTANEVNYLIHPNAEQIVEYVVPQSIYANLFRIFLEAVVSEHVSRMIAMNMATDNAENMIKELTQLYNRARQAQITSEISEIMGAARALKKG